MSQPRQPHGIPAGGEFAARTHGEATDVALTALAENLYPNGVCGSCGQGLSDDGRCQNDEDSCGNAGRVVDEELNERWGAEQVGDSITYQLDLTDFVDVEAAVDAIEAAIAASAEGLETSSGSVLHDVVSRLRFEGYEVADAERLLDDPAFSALFVDQWPPGTPDSTVVDGQVTRNWKGFGFTPSEMRTWKWAGITLPALARKLHHGEFAVRPELLALVDEEGVSVGRRVDSGEIAWFNAASHARRAAVEAARREAERIGF